MIATISAIIWTLLGLYFLWRPQSFTKRLHKKGRRVLTRYLIIAWALAAWTLGSLSFEVAGIWPKVVAVILAICLFIGGLRLRKWFLQALEQHSQLLGRKWVRRIAFVYIAIGIGIIGISRISRMLQPEETGTRQEAPDLTPGIGEDIDSNSL